MSILDNLNYIQEINRIPCAQPSPIIMIKTALQAAPPALINLLSPDCETDAEAALFGKRGVAPRPVGRQPRHRNMRGNAKWLLKPISMGGRKYWFAPGYALAQRFLWYWLVADVTVEFVATWHSLVYQEQQCQLPGAGTVDFRWNTPILPAGATNQMGTQSTKMHPGINFGTFIFVHPGFEATIVMQGDWYRWPTLIPTDTMVHVWLERTDNVDSLMDEATANDPAAGNGNRTGLAWYAKPRGIMQGEQYRIMAHNPGSHHVWNPFATGHASMFGRKYGSIAVGCAREFVTSANGYVFKPGPEWPFPRPEWL